MNDQIRHLYQLPDISAYEDVHLLTLRSNCDALEEQLRNIGEHLSYNDQQILETYIDIRNELEFETVKTALRWGKHNYR